MLRRSLSATARLRPTLALTAAAVVAAPTAHAQARRELRSNANARLETGVDWWLTSRTAVQIGATVGRSRLGLAPQQLELRGGVQRALAGGLSGAVGYTSAHSTPYGAFPARFPSAERRLWEQLSFDQRVGPVSLTHRYRVEQRWRELLSPNDEDSVAAPSAWTFLQRARYQLRATVPLRDAAAGGATPYAVLSNELFVHFGHNAPLNLLDQNRAVAALGMRWKSGTRAELGYLSQVVLRADGRQIESNNTVQLAVTLVHRAPASRPVHDAATAAH